MRRLLAFVLFCLLSTSAFAIEPPREKERWTTLAIDELTVYSSADDYTTRSVASDLVRLRNALGVVTQLKVRSPLPTRVFIFGDRRSFEQYCQAAIGRSDNLSGVFLSDRDGNHVLIAGNSIDDAFQAAFHTSYDELERELRKYIRAFTMNYIRYTMADLKAVEIPAPQPLPRDVQLVALADLLMHTNTPHFIEAEGFLNAALKTNPSGAAVYAELGVAKSWQRQNAEAEANFEKAVQLGSRDAQPYILYGQSILRRVDASVRHNAGAPSADVLKARELFRKATELNPSSAPAFSGLGATYTMVAAGDPQPGIEALERSLALAPAEVDAIFNLIVLDARAGRREAAAKSLDALARFADAETVRHARENLYIADLNHASELLRAGKHAEATEIMKRVAAETTNAQLKAQIEEQLTSIGHVDAANRQVSEFQLAVNTASDGKFKEALTMIDALLPTITEPELLSAAKDFRAKVTQYIAATTPKKKSK